MNLQKEYNTKSITAIIPAYNEEGNIAHVLRPLKESKLFKEIIVIDDGSVDQTGEVARSHGVRVLTQKNSGKGMAMQSGAREANGDILCFFDADLIGLTPDIVAQLIAPLTNSDTAMTIGLRDKSWFTHIAPLLAPVLGGERAVSRELFGRMMETPFQAQKNFGIETIMNAYCKKNKLTVTYVVMPGVTHVIKEKKYGLWIGFIARIQMIFQIVAAEIERYKRR